MCYTYDSLSRVTTRTIRKISDNSLVSTETFNYDAAGNLTDAPDSCFGYDTNNRLVVFNGNTVSYDLDGNMLSNGSLSCTYDSANRLISAGGHTYTYNAEDVRIRNLCTDEDTTYTYDTNGKLSKLLCKTTGGVTTKYVYGRGLIGEEVNSTFKTYHFDCRGSTIAITDAIGNITDTFAYDTYGKLTGRTGTNKVIFGYNGRDGVITDDNGLIYMRARYYSPSMKRFINADVIAGAISNAITLNRFAYANGNPVSFVDPFGLSAERGMGHGMDYVLGGWISPWGTPNTHVTQYDNYWLERWYGPDGRAIKDRHWTNHGNPKHHTVPHEQHWDWSDLDHPTLPPNSNPPSNPPSSPPSSEGEEPWYQEDPPKSSDDSSDKENQSHQKQSSSIGEVIGGVVVVTLASVALVWLVGNDATGIGAVDDVAIAPAVGAFEYGMRLILGT